MLSVVGKQAVSNLGEEFNNYGQDASNCETYNEATDERLAGERVRGEATHDALVGARRCLEDEVADILDGDDVVAGVGDRGCLVAPTDEAGDAAHVGRSAAVCRSVVVVAAVNVFHRFAAGQSRLQLHRSKRQMYITLV